MGQLINFKNFNPQVHSKVNASVASGEVDKGSPVSAGFYPGVEYKLTLNILIHNYPGKVCFSIKEAAAKLGVGEEFIRRRIKTGTIKATYLGDKPLINIVELARIITEGV